MVARTDHGVERGYATFIFNSTAASFFADWELLLQTVSSPTQSLSVTPSQLCPGIGRQVDERHVSKTRVIFLCVSKEASLSRGSDLTSRNTSRSTRPMYSNGHRGAKYYRDGDVGR